MVVLKEKEICPKKDTCIFADDSGQKCYGCCERNSTFVCDLDFADEGVQLNQSLLACVI
jgi:hypothetical protein